MTCIGQTLSIKSWQELGKILVISKKYSWTSANSHLSKTTTFVIPADKKSILWLLFKTSLPRPLSSVSEVAVVERFNCMKIKFQQQLYDWWLSLLKTLIFVSYTRSSKRIYAAIYIPQNFMSFYIHNFGKEKEAYWHRIVTYLNKFKFHHIQFIKVRLCISQ